MDHGSHIGRDLLGSCLTLSQSLTRTALLQRYEGLTLLMLVADIDTGSLEASRIAAAPSIVTDESIALTILKADKADT